MSKVTIHGSPETPIEMMAADGKSEETIKDALGRTLTLRKPGLLDEFRAVDAVGKDTAENTVWMGMYMPLLHLAAIDGDPITQATSKLEAEALIQRVGNEGYLAITSTFAKKDDTEKDKNAAKN